MYETHRGRHLKAGSENRMKQNMKTVMTAFREKKHKVKILTILRYNSNGDFIF